ncbi:hypothetical protein [Glycomyces lechevalierae]|uniref:Ead/Ea22-like family protein n=1 Tax=Glycomyces lechevalierae TaxID=256034 RepID=A0ABU2AHW9_9ACTN|nr:hypothetical protein [Glycomyces lechevalierae]MDR7336803.1 hypothetical protein [Glycomyces lechevalierae]
MTYPKINPATVLDEIAAERARQDAQWGEQNHPDGTGPKVVLAGGNAWMEEHAEHARRECQTAADAEAVTWRHILREEVYEAFAEFDPAALRAELVQVAAVAVAWIEAIDRREAS